MSEMIVDQMLDVPEVFRPVVAQYGRAMFTLVMSAGVAGEAMNVAGALAIDQRNPALMRAITTLGNSFNQVSNAYVKQMGWSEATVAQCDRDLQLAFAGKISTPTAAIVLDS